MTKGTRRAAIRLRNPEQPGQVLEALGQAVELLEFVKVRPTMESLFIQAVQSGAAKTEPAS